jgi:IS5 family transposase
MIKNSMFADRECDVKLIKLGDTLRVLEWHLDYAALAAAVERAPSLSPERGSIPPFPIERIVRALLIQQLFNLSGAQMEIRLIDRIGLQRFVGLRSSSQTPIQATFSMFMERLMQSEACDSTFDALNVQLSKLNYMVRGGRMIDASIVETSKQSINKEEKVVVADSAMPADWSPAKPRQKVTEAPWTEEHCKSHIYQLSANADKRYKLIRKIKSNTASEHDTLHFEDSFDPVNTNYVDGEREARLRGHGWRVHIQARAARTSLSQQHRSTATCASPRPARASSMSLPNWRRWVTRWYSSIGLVRATLYAAYNLQRLSYLEEAKIVAF